MVKLQVREAAEARGIRNATQLKKAAGISSGAAARLWKGDAETVSLKTLDSLCDALGCKLADLLVRMEEQKQLKQAKARWENEGGAVQHEPDFINLV